jgi:hypothetical protein
MNPTVNYAARRMMPEFPNAYGSQWEESRPCFDQYLPYQAPQYPAYPGPFVDDSAGGYGPPIGYRQAPAYRPMRGSYESARRDRPLMRNDGRFGLFRRRPRMGRAQLNPRFY